MSDSYHNRSRWGRGYKISSKVRRSGGMILDLSVKPVKSSGPEVTEYMVLTDREQPQAIQMPATQRQQPTATPSDREVAITARPLNFRELSRPASFLVRAMEASRHVNFTGGKGY